MLAPHRPRSWLPTPSLALALLVTACADRSADLTGEPETSTGPHTTAASGGETTAPATTAPPPTTLPQTSDEPPTPTSTSTADAADTTTTASTTTTGPPLTTGADPDTTTESGPFGQCGWHPDNYYACAVDGATPGLVDPRGKFPIFCADGLVEGASCKDMVPVDEIGCCTLDGTLFYCDSQDTFTIIRQDCGP